MQLFMWINLYKMVAQGDRLASERLARARQPMNMCICLFRDGVVTIVASLSAGY